MTEGPIDISSISTTMPKLSSVRLMRFAFALISPTPGLPRSPSKRESGGGVQALPLLRMSMGENPSSSFFVFRGTGFILVSIFSTFSTALSTSASSLATSSPPTFFSSREKTLFMSEIISILIEASNMISIDMTTRARSSMALT